MNFISIDFETPNSKNNSICSLGLVIVKNNEITFCKNYLIDPEAPFSSYNTKIHGITRETVERCPTFPKVWDEIKRYFNHYPVVAHNASFEKSVLEKTARNYNIKLPIITYYCTQKIAEYNFPELDRYSLEFLCNEFNVELKNHHCSIDDSLAAAKLMLRYLSYDDINVFASCVSDVEFTLSRQKTKYNEADVSTEYPKIHYDRHPKYEAANVEYSDCSISIEGFTFVITGEAKGRTRSEIKQMIVDHGGIVSNNISRKINYLVVGDLDVNVIADSENIKSTKIVKAEELIKQGYDIKIIPISKLLKGCEE